MMRRLAVLILALSALIGVSVSGPQPAHAADHDGIISSGVTVMCKAGGAIVEFFGGEKGPNADGKCKTLGAAVQMKAEKEWDEISDSLLGDVIKSAAGLAKWTIGHALTLGLEGPSLDLSTTGLWGGKATLAGMLVWLGLLIATAGVMWQLAKMAVTGQAKHLGRAFIGWGENFLISSLGVSLFGLLLKLGDAITDGLVQATFNENNAYARIVAVMIPAGVANPVAVGGVVGVLLLVGIVQMVMVFMRMSAIPVICLMLPIAGAGRAGGDATRKWAPALITSGLVIVVYKPIVAILICTGFSHFGHGETLTEWLRGVATLVLAVIAPVPLTRIFAPFGAAVGGGMAAGGASAALGAAASYFGRTRETGGGEAAAPDTPMAHARRVQMSMDGGGDDPPPPPPPPSPPTPSPPPKPLTPPDPSDPSDPSQPGGPQEPPQTPAIPGQASASTPAAVPATSSTATGAPGKGGSIGMAIQVIDGVNDVVQQASEEVGGGSGQ
ncbi:hypothetical protein [Streptomyces sp. NPDC001591]|uniref:hypothetical protein n=1 Tax=Streptomyces sp. NPDC001591 TaxID=3364589 RepID=UPI003674FF94